MSWFVSTLEPPLRCRGGDQLARWQFGKSLLPTYLGVEVARESYTSIEIQGRFT